MTSLRSIVVSIPLLTCECNPKAVKVNATAGTIIRGPGVYGTPHSVQSTIVRKRRASTAADTRLKTVARILELIKKLVSTRAVHHAYTKINRPSV